LTRTTRRLLAAAATTACALAASAPAQAADTFTRYKGFNAPGPSKYDKVGVLKQGKSSAKNVLVLVPGTSGSSGYFRQMADAIIKKAPDWQVWSVERRENLLEDHSMSQKVLNGTATVDEMFDYYLGWIGSTSTAPHFEPVKDTDVAFARQWGMEVAVEDIRVVIKQANRGGRKVVLGGHSLGGSIVGAYASWDFDGKAGAKDLDGLVMIDGGTGKGTAGTAAEAEKALQDLEGKSPFIDLTGTGLVWSAGIFALVGSTYAIKEPDKPSKMQSWPLLPADLKPPVPATNEGQYGFALDSKTGPKDLALVQMHIGRLADSGDPRGWVDDGITPVQRAAHVFSGWKDLPGIDGTAWYHPARLSLDSRAVNGGNENPAQAILNVKATHGDELDFPIYAWASSLGGKRVLDGAKSLARQSGVSKKDLTLVDKSKTEAHCDPMGAAPAKNSFVKTVVPFLKEIG
jgi:pimeloyl-ACP methyl ester carboxylesterase